MKSKGNNNKSVLKVVTTKTLQPPKRYHSTDMCLPAVTWPRHNSFASIRSSSGPCKEAMLEVESRLGRLREWPLALMVGQRCQEVGARWLVMGGGGWKALQEWNFNKRRCVQKIILAILCGKFYAVSRMKGLTLFIITLLRMTLFLWNDMAWPSQTTSLGLRKKTCASLIVRNITWRLRSWWNCKNKHMEACIVLEKY
jgi:hypothetical protein